MKLFSVAAYFNKAPTNLLAVSIRPGFIELSVLQKTGQSYNQLTTAHHVLDQTIATQTRLYGLEVLKNIITEFASQYSPHSWLLLDSVLVSSASPQTILQISLLGAKTGLRIYKITSLGLHVNHKDLSVAVVEAAHNYLGILEGKNYQQHKKIIYGLFACIASIGLFLSAQSIRFYFTTKINRIKQALIIQRKKVKEVVSLEQEIARLKAVKNHNQIDPTPLLEFLGLSIDNKSWLTELSFNNSKDAESQEQPEEIPFVIKGLTADADSASELVKACMHHINRGDISLKTIKNQAQTEQDHHPGYTFTIKGCITPQELSSMNAWVLKNAKTNDS